MARGSQSETTDRDQDKELPLWISLLYEKFAPPAERVEKALTLSLAKLTDGIEEVTRRQSEIISCLDALEERVTSLQSSSPVDRNPLFSTLVKVKADSERIGGKLGA
uniref:Uncharacterized protein n=1 Tax=Haemonchus contortus TaxID=6289 RepID=A0A7I4Y7Q0_HAECO